MTLFYPRSADSHALRYVLGLLFGSAMVLSIIFGVTAIRRGDVSGHRAWMIGGYALGLGAGTQVLYILAASHATQFSRERF